VVTLGKKNRYFCKDPHTLLLGYVPLATAQFAAPKLPLTSSRAPTAGFFSRPVLAGLLGNVLEWYDFMVYGYFVPTLKSLFFPTSDPLAALIAAYGVLAVSFVMRPVGALMFGHVGDRLGRKRALELSVILMAVPSLLFGFLPTYESIGIAAPIGLLVLRLLQGLSVGGEYTASFSFVIEHAPAGRRGLHGALTTCGAILGILLASLAAFLTSRIAQDENTRTWAWRIPFLLGVFVAGVALWVRRRLQETATFERMRREGALAKQPVREAITHEWRGILRLFWLYALGSAFFYVLYLFVQAALVEAGMVAHEAQLATSCALCVLVLALPAAGYASDLFGRRRVMLSGVLATVILVVPLYRMLFSLDFTRVALAQVALTVLVALVIGPVPSTMAEMFPPRTRFSSMSIGYNGSLAVFGGTAPMVAGILTRVTGSPLGPAYYLVALALISGVAIYMGRETHRDEFA
jgi:MHS family proline/betaine transporter-like MFS transporter